MSTRTAIVLGAARAASGVAAVFATRLSSLLSERGDDVVLVLVHPEGVNEPVAERWREHGLRRGVSMIDVRGGELRQSRSPYVPAMWSAERATEALREFDVVYADDAANGTFHLVRTRRFSAARHPVCITVLHGGRWSTLAATRAFPDVPSDLHLDFLERYAARHGDFVVAETDEAVAAARRAGWSFSAEPEVLGRIDHGGEAAWLAFHERAVTRAAEPPPVPRRVVPGEVPAVDVCITYFEKAPHFPWLLRSLVRQTRQDFHVVAVDDGSPGAGARRCFDEMAATYAPRGWTFFRQENAWVDAARNRAAERGRADYLLMVDADDVLAPNAIERFLEAAARSGADCLVSRSCLFTGDGDPLDRDGKLVAPLFARCDPLGADVAGGLFAPEVFGGPVVLIRRAVFEAIGGYREERGSAHEDWELHARLALAGYATDVVPEDLHFYRVVGNGLASTTDEFLAKRRIIGAYENHLAGAGLGALAAAAYALHRRSRGPAERDAGPAATLQKRLVAYADDDEGSFLVRRLRGTYRRLVPLGLRLRIDERLRGALGRGG